MLNSICSSVHTLLQSRRLGQQSDTPLGVLGHLHQPAHFTALTAKLTLRLQVEAVGGLVEKGGEDGLIEEGQLPEAAAHLGQRNS
ncbi:hypothetical protein TYRP_004209 [Tyrophagus putrescentiae]|nr:hypothetical protein TYRP_004209 [Tyrophagus putrescentiae]